MSQKLTEKSPEHVGESKEKKGSSAKSINGPHSRPSEQKVDQAKAPTGPQSSVVGNSALSEDCAGVERDDVDTAHLLSNHDNTGSPSGAPDARNGEELKEASEDVVGLCEASLLGKDFLLVEDTLDVVEISGGLKGRVSESQE